MKRGKMINLQLIAFTLDFAGKILIAFSVLLVHYKMRKERRIDRLVVKEIMLEELLTLLGIVFIIVGYFLHIIPLV